MKLLTLNTHSLIEEAYESKLHIFTDTVLSEKPDIIALQEVNQSISAKPAKLWERFRSIGTIKPTRDNHALKAYELLRDGGLDYHTVWSGMKCGYGRFDEGLAIMSLNPINHTKTVTLSQRDDYSFWKTRKCLLADCGNIVICNTHMGWWDDTEEPFSAQWKKLSESLASYKKQIFLMGDFNSPADTGNEGYHLITSSGWYDTYTLAKEKDDGFTVSGKPDGWSKELKARIDYIFTNRNAPVQ